MHRIIRVAATLMTVTAIGATMATTVSASSAVPTTVSPGSHWTVTTAHQGCENEHFLTGHKFVGDEASDRGTWSEPTMTTITMTWTGGEDKGTVFKGTFKPASGHYKGTINFSGGPTGDPAMLIPGTRGGC